jgi:CPA2 family monovalent cation:H+ antiporter-2
MFILILGSDSSESVLSSVVKALSQAAAAVAIIAIVGRIVLRPLFRLEASTQSNGLFIATTLFVVVATRASRPISCRRW